MIDPDGKKSNTTDFNSRCPGAAPSRSPLVAKKSLIPLNISLLAAAAKHDFHFAML
jgi:hypothetical protein